MSFERPRKTFQKAWRNAAPSASPSGDFEEGRAQVAAELVPVRDALPRLLQQLVAAHRQLGLVLVRPALDLLFGHLGVELDSPGAIAEAERLRADRAPCQLDGAGRDPMRVVVPLERLEPLGQAAEQLVVACLLRQLDRVPADLGLG